MPAFNEAARKELFSISLPFLNCSEMFLFMSLFYNALCAVFEASVLMLQNLHTVRCTLYKKIINKIFFEKR